MIAFPRMFVLDTDVASHLTSPVPDTAIVAWMARAPAGTLWLSASTVFELQLGVELARRRGNSRADGFEQRLDEVLADPRFRILATTAEAARIRAAMAADPALGNLAIRDPRAKRQTAGEKLAIAACAMANGLAIATMNERDFKLIGRRFALPGVFHPGKGLWDGIPSARADASAPRPSAGRDRIPAERGPGGSPEPCGTTERRRAIVVRIPAGGRRRLPDARSVPSPAPTTGGRRETGTDGGNRDR